MSLKEIIGKFIDEGSRVAWTAVEAAAGFLAAYHVPDDLFDFLGVYEPAAVAAVGVAIAALATKLKEIVRGKRSPE